MKSTGVKLLSLGLLWVLFGSSSQLHAGLILAQQTVQDKVSAVATQPTEKKGGKLKDTFSSAEGGQRNQSLLKVNLNTATAEQLAKALNGIGMKKAEAIVSYREQYGTFTDIEQLKEVPGIGPSFLKQNFSRMTL